MLLLYPGESGPLTSLQGFLRDHHEEERASRDKQIAEQASRGITSSDTTDFVQLAKEATAATDAAVALDAVACLAAARRVMDGLADALTPLGEYVDDPAIDGVMVAFVALSERDSRRLSRDAIAASEVARTAPAGRARDDAYQAISDARVALLAVALARVEGLQDADGRGRAIVRGDDQRIDVGALGALQRAGLHVPLYEAACLFQVLPAKKGLRYGSPAASTYGASGALTAQSIDDKS